MVRHPISKFPLVVLLTVGGLLSAEGGPRLLPQNLLVSIRAAQPLRAARIAQGLEAEKAAMGLGMLDGLKEFNTVTDAMGRTHGRFHQTYRGVEVYNGIILGHMDASGNLMATQATVQEEINLQPAALLSEAKITEIVLRQLPKEGRLLPLKIEPLVFPTKYQDGLKLMRDPQGNLTIDPTYSVGTRRKSDPYRWAFQVSASQISTKGLASAIFIIDGLTGELLQKRNGVQYLDGKPAVGSGNSQYNGTVKLNTLQLADGSFTLRDTTRATKPWPHATDMGIPEFDVIGIQTVCADPTRSTASGTVPYLSATNTWGDGQAFSWATDYPGNMLAPRGQTAAVDAHSNILVTWDYYNNVLGRSGGIDGQGSSPVSIVHAEDPSSFGKMDNAYWSTPFFAMYYGDGGATGPLTCLDVAAHEMSHGLMASTARLEYIDESGALNEANSDIHGLMVKFYMWGAGGQGHMVPDQTTAAPGGRNIWNYLWTVGSQLSTDGVTPMRYCYKPSKDGMSHDAWFNGIGLDDVHFSSGPGNRAFYFLAQGASGDRTQETYSLYLPSGMSGIGNDKAIKIWYHAMTHIVTNPKADYHAIREAMIASATDLFPGYAGADSPEIAAVKNAFAAINVGGPAGGRDPLRVRFPQDQVFVAPAMLPTTIWTPYVANAADTSVSWELGGLSPISPAVGRLEGGRFVGPMVNGGIMCPLKAISKEDPRQFAVTGVFCTNLDIDGDSDVDACDLGAMALAYGGLVQFVYPNAVLFNRANFADDICLEIFNAGFYNAFNQ